MSSQTVYFTNPSVISGIQSDISNAATTKYIPTGPSRQQSSRQAATSNSATAGPTNQNYLADTSRFMRDADGVSKYESFHVEQLSHSTGEHVFIPVSDSNYLYTIIRDVQISAINNPFGLQQDLNADGDKIGALGNYFYLIKVDKATGKVVQQKNIGDYRGLYTTDFQHIATMGADESRGPMTIYNGHIYIASTSFRYFTVYKIRCSDLSLVWYNDIETPEEGIVINTVLKQWSSYKNQIRYVDVIPPSNGRTNPLVIISNGSAAGYGRAQTTYVGGLNYGPDVKNAMINSLAREFGTITSEGTIYAYDDLGTSATRRWKFNSMPNNYTTGDSLKQTSFRKNSDGTLIDGLEIMYPLTNGYQFNTGSASAGIERTAGTFDILTGEYFMDYSTALGIPGLVTAAQAKEGFLSATGGAAFGYNNNFFHHSWNNIFEGCKAEFAKVVFPHGTTFYNTGSYTGTVQNGPRNGTIVTIPGTAIYSVSPSGSQGQWYHPVPKTLYLQQCATGVNPKVLDQYEAYGLSFKGATPYGNYCYDQDTDTLMVGFGNSQSAPRQHGLDYWSWVMTQATGGTADGDFAKANPIFAGWRYLTDTICNVNGIVGTGAAMVADQRAKQARYYGFQDNWRLSTGGYWGGDKYNRALTDSVVGINANNGGLKFACNLNGMDSFAFATSLNGEGTPLNLFYGGGANVDAAKGCMIITIPQPDPTTQFVNNVYNFSPNLYLNNSTGTANWGAANEQLWKRNQTGPVKVMVASTKDRVFLYDFDRLVNDTTLTHVTGDSSIDFQQGIKNNTYENYELWYQREAIFTIGHSFNGLTYDGNRLITKIAGGGAFNLAKGVAGNSPLVNFLIGNQAGFILPSATVFEEGLEKHYGAILDPLYNYTRIPGYVISPVLYGYKPLITLLNNVPSSFINMVDWAFLQQNDQKADGQKYLDNGPMSVYGQYIISGNSNGSLYFVDKDTGALAKEIYNEEGVGGGALVNDGIIYCMGGKSKWSAFVSSNIVGTKLTMYTPYGK